MTDNETPFFLPFLKKEKIAEDTYNFYFKRTGKERDFIPGQYYEIKLKIKNPDERGDTRVFTCSSSPTEKNYLMFTTRIIESSFKKAFHDLKKRDMVQFNGPWDDLNFDESEELPQIFLAGGIGVTPFHSIVKYAIDKKLTLPMMLFVSWINPKEMVFDKFFKDAEKRLADFKYIPTITEFDDLKNWKGETGRISERMIKKYFKKVRFARFRISGPPGLVKAMRELCVQMNVPKENIIAEEFEGY